MKITKVRGCETAVDLSDSDKDVLRWTGVKALRYMILQSRRPR